MKRARMSSLFHTAAQDLDGHLLATAVFVLALGQPDLAHAAAARYLDQAVVTDQAAGPIRVNAACQLRSNMFD